MRIAIVNIPFKTPWLGKDKWITIPPQGYGGIQWILKNIIDGLLELGHEIFLLGAPGSPFNNPNIRVLPLGEPREISSWIENNPDKYDLISDHSCRGVEFPEPIDWHNALRVHSHYLSSKPAAEINIVAASYAHAKKIGFPDAPVIRHPVNPANFTFSADKEDYLLFLGRISDWKGPDWAADFAKKAGMKLIISGPVWEPEYFEAICHKYKNNIEYIGETGGSDRIQLLSKAKAILVFSKSVKGPSGDIWVEPGSTVVSEAAISGTPVISSLNGCLKEIVPNVGITCEDPTRLSKSAARNIVSSLPSPGEIHEYCLRNWGYLVICRKYIDLFMKVMNNESW